MRLLTPLSLLGARQPLILAAVSALAVASGIGVGLLVTSLLDEDEPLSAPSRELRDRLVDMNAQLYGALRLAQDDLQAHLGDDFVAYATVQPALDFCYSIDLAALRADPAFDPPVHDALVTAFDRSCLQLDAPLLLNPQRELDWRVEIAEVVQRLEAALRGSGARLPQPPFARLPAYRDPGAPATTNELTAFLEGEVARRLYGSLRIAAGDYTEKDCPAPCGIVFDFGVWSEVSVAFCGKAVDADSFRQEPGYNPTAHEPLLTSLDQACALLYAAIDDLGSPADVPAWRAVFLEAFETLDAALPAHLRPDATSTP